MKWVTDKKEKIRYILRFLLFCISARRLWHFDIHMLHALKNRNRNRKPSFPWKNLYSKHLVIRESFIAYVFGDFLLFQAELWCRRLSIESQSTKYLCFTYDLDLEVVMKKFARSILWTLEDLYRNQLLQFLQEVTTRAYEPPRDKTNKMTVRPAKTQISLGIRPVWSESSLCVQWVARAQGFFMRTAKTLISLGGCPGWSES